MKNYFCACSHNVEEEEEPPAPLPVPPQAPPPVPPQALPPVPPQAPPPVLPQALPPVPPQAPPPVLPQALPPVPLQALPPAPPQALPEHLEPPVALQVPPLPQALREQSEPRVPASIPPQALPEQSDPSDAENASPDHAQLPPPQLANPGVTFTWQEILEGTNNFWSQNFLTGGMYRYSPLFAVYRCHLPRINMVGAVKVQDLSNPDYPKEYAKFEKEVTTLERANHPNVIRLLGKCVEPGHHSIVYEFMPRGSLENYIFAPERPIPALIQDNQVLSWERRMNIAVGVAQALVYVHNVLRMVHGNVNFRNVSLDENFVPKLTDFGSAVPISVDVEGDEIYSDIDMVTGLLGCIAPETRQSGLIWTKSDVFSYGVFLYQLFTAQKAYDRQRPSEIIEITDWFSLPIMLREEHYPLLIDLALDDRFSVEGLNRIFETARQCTNDQANDRPGMNIVEDMVRQAAEYVVP